MCPATRKRIYCRTRTIVLLLGLASVVLIKHVSENVLRVFESLHHFQVGAIHSRAKWISSAFTSLVHVGHNFGLRAQHDLSVILEVHLNDFV